DASSPVRIVRSEWSEVKDRPHIVGARPVFNRGNSAIREVTDRLKSIDANCIADLMGALEAVREGDLTREVVPVTTPVEIEASGEVGELVETFNAVLAKMQASIGLYNVVRSEL